MIYLLILIYMVIFPITTIVMLYMILEKLEKEKEKANTKQTDSKRKIHPGIAKTSYASPLAGRRSVPGYEQYKNESGLYEPITPSNGIKIKKKED